jgi:class 3 adenylate cyclase
MGSAWASVLAHRDRLPRPLAKEGVRSNLTVPLLVGQNAVGAFFLDSVISNAYTERDIELVDPVAQQLALAIDNTRLFQEVEAKGRQLEVANNHKSQFLAHVSHELRTPLNAILGYTELILDGIYGEVPEKIRAIMQRVEANSRHLLSLINDVLDLSKIDAGSLTLINSDYSMEETVRAAASNVASLAAAKHLALKIELAPSLPRARGDEGTLERFTGDGIMIFFNDPVVIANPAERALRMALAMRDRVNELKLSWTRQGYELSLGIGMAQGFATLGAIGFEGRIDYGALGTVTNLAARLCGEARDGQILTNRKTLIEIEQMVEAEGVGELRLKGFAKPLLAFNIKALIAPEQMATRPLA